MDSVLGMADDPLKDAPDGILAVYEIGLCRGDIGLARNLGEGVQQVGGGGFGLEVTVDA